MATSRMTAPILFLALGVSFALVSAAKADDGFAAYFKSFQTALANNDRAAVERMMRPALGMPEPGFPKTLDQYYAKYFPRPVRACFATARARPKASRGVYTVDMIYEVHCRRTTYIFGRLGDGTWAYTDFIPDNERHDR